jgi:hypothetical protein
MSQSGPSPATLIAALAEFEPWSLLAVLEAAANSPTAGHRRPTVALLWLVSFRHPPAGDRVTTAADLPALLREGAAAFGEPLASEDQWPPDPRLVVRHRAGPRRWRLLPGHHERAPRELRRLDLLTAALTGHGELPPDIRSDGQRLQTLITVVLAAADHAATVFESAWSPLPGEAASYPGAPDLERLAGASAEERVAMISGWPASVTDAEVKAANAVLAPWRRTGRDHQSAGAVSRWEPWLRLLPATRSPQRRDAGAARDATGIRREDVAAQLDSLTANADDVRLRWGYNQAPFGATLALRGPLGLLPIPASFLLTTLFQHARDEAARIGDATHPGNDHDAGSPVEAALWNAGATRTAELLTGPGMTLRRDRPRSPRRANAPTSREGGPVGDIARGPEDEIDANAGALDEFPALLRLSPRTWLAVDVVAALDDHRYAHAVPAHADAIGAVDAAMLRAGGALVENSDRILRLLVTVGPTRRRGVQPEDETVFVTDTEALAELLAAAAGTDGGRDTLWQFIDDIVNSRGRAHLEALDIADLWQQWRRTGSLPWLQDPHSMVLVGPGADDPSWAEAAELEPLADLLDRLGLPAPWRWASVHGDRPTRRSRRLGLPALGRWTLWPPGVDTVTFLSIEPRVYVTADVPLRGPEAGWTTDAPESADYSSDADAIGSTEGVRDRRSSQLLLALAHAVRDRLADHPDLALHLAFDGQPAHIHLGWRRPSHHLVDRAARRDGSVAVLALVHTVAGGRIEFDPGFLQFAHDDPDAAHASLGDALDAIAHPAHRVVQGEDATAARRSLPITPSAGQDSPVEGLSRAVVTCAPFAARWQAEPSLLHTGTGAPGEPAGQVHPSLPLGVAGRAHALYEVAVQVRSRLTGQPDPGTYRGRDAARTLTEVAVPAAAAALARRLGQHCPDSLVDVLVALDAELMHRSVAEAHLTLALDSWWADDARRDALEDDVPLPPWTLLEVVAEHLIAYPPSGAARMDQFDLADTCELARELLLLSSDAEAAHRNLESKSVIVDERGFIGVGTPRRRSATAQDGSGEVEPGDVNWGFDSVTYSAARRAHELRPRPLTDDKTVGKFSEAADSLDASGSSDGGGRVEAAVMDIDADEELTRRPFMSMRSGAPRSVVKVDDAMVAALGVSLDAITAVLAVASSWPTSTGPVWIHKEHLVAEVSTWADVPVEQIEVAISLLRLTDDGLRGEGLRVAEKEQRRHRLATRPLIAQSDGTLLLLPRLVDLTRRIWLTYLSDARLPLPPADIPPSIDQALMAWRSEPNIDFERLVEAAAAAAGLPHAGNVDQKHGNRVGLQLRSEIDLLVADPRRRRLYVVEAKDTTGAYSARSLRTRIQRFLKRDGSVAKLSGKADDVRTNPAAAARLAGVDPDTAASTPWTVQPVMVTRTVEPAAYARHPGVPFLILDDLTDALTSGRNLVAGPNP